MRFQFSNHASALVTSTVTATASTVTLEAGSGGKFPVLPAGDRFRATLISVSGATEIVDVTAKAGDVFTIERAQEGTAAQTFAGGSRFECRLTAGMAANFLQRTGDVMAGDIDMAGHQILNVVFPGTVRFTHIHTQLIRPIDADPNVAYNPTIETSAIVVPPQSSGARPSYNGRSIMNGQLFDGLVFDWYGDVNHVPAWFKLCDGTNGTPDLRGKYIKGWTATFGVSGHGGQEITRADPADAFGISWGLVMDVNGSHSHGGNTLPHTLTIAEMPSHQHPVFGTTGGGGTSGSGSLGSGNKDTGLEGGGLAHTHGINPDGVHNHWTHQPPFFVLAKVMFVNV